MQLVKLYHCEYRDGRAASAPIMRKGASDKRTLATEGAEEEDLMMAESDENAQVVMPHLEYGRQQLDAIYPSVDVVEPEVLDDVEIVDKILDHGLKLASTIQDEMHQSGRTRRSPNEDLSTNHYQSRLQPNSTRQPATRR